MSETNDPHNFIPAEKMLTSLIDAEKEKIRKARETAALEIKKCNKVLYSHKKLLSQLTLLREKLKKTETKE